MQTLDDSENEEQESLEELFRISTEYEGLARREFIARIEAWPPDFAALAVFEVVGGLVARQLTLATHLSASPTAWTGHLAPLVLRAMTDVYINLAWVWKEPLERANAFIRYGLGQEKLTLEHHIAWLEEQGEDPDESELVNAWRHWLDSQRFTFLTEVNLGSWSGKDVRTMADEAGCLDLYRFAYQPFSTAVHSQWGHIAKYNLGVCSNPLHGFHRLPAELNAPLDIDYVYRAAKYLEKTYRLFDRETGISVDVQSAFEYLRGELFEESPGGEDSDPAFPEP